MILCIFIKYYLNQFHLSALSRNFHAKPELSLYATHSRWPVSFLLRSSCRWYERNLWFEESLPNLSSMWVWVWVYIVRINESFARWPIFSFIDSMLICVPQKVEVVISSVFENSMWRIYICKISTWIGVTVWAHISEMDSFIEHTKTVHLRLARKRRKLSP